MAKNPFSSKIKIYSSNSKKALKVCQVDIPSDLETEFSDLLMSQFIDLELDEFEKMALSLERRQILAKFALAHKLILIPLRKKLVNELRNLDHKKIQIKAAGVGAAICLASINSRELINSTDYHFILEDLPLKLIPKKQYKSQKKSKNIMLELNFNKDGWLAELESVARPTKELKTQYKTQFKAA